MKDIVTYINEVSKELAQRAYKKAKGAQKNRIKKLYKEIHGKDISIKDPEVGKFAYDWNREKWEIEEWSTFADKDEWDSIVRRYDTDGMMEDSYSYCNYTEDDIVVGVSNKNGEQAAFYWGPGNLYYKK